MTFFDNHKPQSATQFLGLLAIVIIVLTAYRGLLWAFSDFTLFFDEAYYWGWAQDLDWGFYSKPPMIAVLIALTTSVCGDGELCVKAGALIVHPLTALLIFAMGRMLFDARVGFFAAVTYLTMPGISWSSLIISTDVVLLFFWALSMVLFLKALRSGSMLYWVAAGVSGGLGLLSKYNMIVFPLSVLFFLFSAPQYKEELKRPGVYVAMVLAVLVFLPNLIWNMQHGFPTFQHTAEISKVSQKTLHFEELGAFLGSQFGVFGVIYFPVMLYIFARARSLWNDESYRFLICFALPFIAIITGLAFLGRAHANWATPTYVAGCILVAAFMITRQHVKLWTIAVVINLLLMVAAYHWHGIANVLNIELTAKNDPFKRVQGWRDLAKPVEGILAQYPSALLLGDTRDALAELIYYVKPHPLNAVAWNPQGELENHYELVTTMDDKLGKDFIYVTEGGASPLMRQSFESVQLLREIHVGIHKDYSLDYQVYYLQNFKGYANERP
jgi:4-amino-4-deoxy-L-arabinose transferase-like glycosyltransferase